MGAEIDFTGSETPSDIARAAIEWYSRKPSPHAITIFYENSIPKLRYEFQGGDADFVCIYRLDKMLESFYSDAEQIFDENLRANFVLASERAILVSYIAFSGMTTMLSHLAVLLSDVFLGTLDDTRMLTSGIVLNSLLARSEHEASLSRPVSKVIRGWINKRIDDIVKRKRDYFVGYMNTHPRINIPTGAGRPKGTKKSEEQKQREDALFEKQLEDAVRKLFKSAGQLPTKTRVAEELGIGGDGTRASALYNKLKRHGIDYDAVAARVKLHE